MTAKNPVLLARVVGRPDDERPRRAYGKWLAENGEPARAELIDVQLGLAKIGYSPRRAAYDDLRAREKALLDAHGEEWRREIETAVGAAWIVRGFVEHVAMPAADFVKNGAALERETPLLHLDLHEVKAHLAEVAACPALSQLRSLDLRGCGLGDDDIGILASSSHLRELRWLGLEDNPFGLPGTCLLAASKGLPRLRVALFAGSNVSPMREAITDWDGSLAETRPTPGSRAIEDVYGRKLWLDPYPTHEARPNRYVV